MLCKIIVIRKIKICICQIYHWSSWERNSLDLIFSTNSSFFFKVARVVQLKLAFMEWFFYDLVILIKLYKIRYLNLDKALWFPRNQAICLKNWKLWRASTALKFNNFCLNFAHVSCLTMSTKVVRDFFYFV